MAQNGTTAGMTIDLSSAPQSCNHCILGKQTCSSVLKEREGARSTDQLGQVHIDLSGPHSILSHSGFRYIMNFIDNYSGYCWTQLLRAKSDAFNAFQTWQLATENWIGSKLCYVVTDNSELQSGEMADWCAERGITHQFTAPHTSAQNGHIKRLHHTLMERSWAMRLSCGTPSNLWDEFIITMLYLTILTASHSLRGRTPYELWFGSKPSLNHLHEIGCKAFIPISGHNLKIAA